MSVLRDVLQGDIITREGQIISQDHQEVMQRLIGCVRAMEGTVFNGMEIVANGPAGQVLTSQGDGTAAFEPVVLCFDGGNASTDHGTGLGADA